MKIAIIGAPGTGKTTLSSGLFYFLKILGKSVEIVPELVKHKVYQGMDFSRDGFDILNNIEQDDFESIFNLNSARHKIDYLIIEAPLMNGYFYASYYNKNLEIPVLEKIAKNKVNTYDIVFFMKSPEGEEYSTFGRKESKEQSLALEEHIAEKFKELNFTKKFFMVSQKTPIDELLRMVGLTEKEIKSRL